MELVIGGLIAFLVEMLLIALLLAPRWTLRTLARPFHALVVDPLADGEYERMLEAIEVQELLALLAGLSNRERAILRARYGLNGGQEESLRQIGARLGLSAERVRQLEHRALGKLAAAGSDRGDS